MNTPKTKWTAGKWKLRTVGLAGKLILRVKMPHGEADIYLATVVTEEGHNVCCLDFGYGRKADEANAQLIALSPEWPEVLQELVSCEVDAINGTNFGKNRDARTAATSGIFSRAQALLAKLPK